MYLLKKKDPSTIEHIRNLIFRLIRKVSEPSSFNHFSFLLKALANFNKIILKIIFIHKNKGLFIRSKNQKKIDQFIYIIRN